MVNLVLLKIRQKMIKNQQKLSKSTSKMCIFNGLLGCSMKKSIISQFFKNIFKKRNIPPKRSFFGGFKTVYRPFLARELSHYSFRSILRSGKKWSRMWSKSVFFGSALDQLGVNFIRQGLNFWVYLTILKDFSLSPKGFCDYRVFRNGLPTGSH